VSVHSQDEAEAALLGGVDLVDVKDPTEGPLGAPEPATLESIRSVVRGPLSAALGEGSPGTLALAALGAALSGADYVKVALSPASREKSSEVLGGVVRAARSGRKGVHVIGVVFADDPALPLDALPRAVASAGAQGVMLDTREKGGRSSLSCLGEAAIGRVVEEARALGLETALAGGLGVDDVPVAAALPVDVLGFRGSACEGGRLGRVSAARVRDLAEALREARSLASSRS
jgi:uncharacterized protein (UPF0264 family)